MSATVLRPVPYPRLTHPPSRGALRSTIAVAASVLIVLGIVSSLALNRWYGTSSRESRSIPAPAAVAATPDPDQIELLWQWDFTSTMHNIDTYLQVAQSPSGAVYVSDDIMDEIHVLDANGTEIETFGGIGPDPGKFDFGNPNNGWYGGQLSFDDAGNLYVFDSTHDRVQKFGPDHALLAYWDVPSEPNGSQESSFVIGTVDPRAKRLYVVTQLSPRVYVYDLDGNLLSSWGTPGRAEGQLTNPTAVAAAPDGTLWIADKSISRIQHFDPDGTYLGSIGERGGAPGQVNMVLGLATDQDGNIYAAEAGNGRVQILRPDGSSVMVFNSVPELGRIVRPNSLWVGNDGALFVVDSKNDRVVKLQLPSLD